VAFTGGSSVGTAPVGSLAMGVPRIQLPRGLDRPLTAQDMLPQLFPRSRPDYIDSKDAYTARAWSADCSDR
jgi:hypothetical protein